MKKLIALSCLFGGIFGSAQSQESYTLAENTAKSSFSIVTKKVTYDDHLMAAQSFNMSAIESFNDIDGYVILKKLVAIPEEGNGYTIEKLTHSKAFLNPRAKTILEKIANAEDVDELNYIRTTNQKKYWWTSIFIAGLFYGLNGKVGKMIITWFVSVITLGIYALYIIYRSYKDETEFNNQMEYYILQRSKELKGKISSSELKLPESDVN